MEEDKKTTNAQSHTISILADLVYKYMQGTKVKQESKPGDFLPYQTEVTKSETISKETARLFQELKNEGKLPKQVIQAANPYIKQMKRYYGN